MAQAVIKVEGMHCGSCELRVNLALEDLSGVQSAQASHEKGEVVVSYDDALITVNDLSTAIIEEGFKVIHD